MGKTSDQVRVPKPILGPRARPHESRGGTGAARQGDPGSSRVGQGTGELMDPTSPASDKVYYVNLRIACSRGIGRCARIPLTRRWRPRKTYLCALQLPRVYSPTGTTSGWMSDEPRRRASILRAASPSSAATAVIVPWFAKAPGSVRRRLSRIRSSVSINSSRSTRRGGS